VVFEIDAPDAAVIAAEAAPQTGYKANSHTQISSSKPIPQTAAIVRLHSWRRLTDLCMEAGISFRDRESPQSCFIQQIDLRTEFTSMRPARSSGGEAVLGPFILSQSN
jgi:hypothetical protein